MIRYEPCEKCGVDHPYGKPYMHDCLGKPLNDLIRDMLSRLEVLEAGE